MIEKIYHGFSSAEMAEYIENLDEDHKKLLLLQYISALQNVGNKDIGLVKVEYCDGNERLIITNEL